MLLVDSRSRSAPRFQHGFSMLEVLIAIVVISFGLLGLAGLQAVSLRNNHNAYLRSVATNLSYDMTDRVRVNSATNYSLLTGANKPDCLTTTGCNAADMALFDTYQWQQAIANALPSGEGAICKDSTPDDGSSAAANGCDASGTLYVIKIWWVDDRSGANTRFVTSFRP